MANRIVEIKQKRVRSGVELQGIARTDRSTKYIVDSIVIIPEEGQPYPTKEQIARGVQQLLAANE